MPWMEKLRVDIWSDIACPWCYVGKRRLEAALARFDERESVEVVWRSFELDPSAKGAPGPTVDGDYAARLARKYRTSPAQAEGMISNMTATGVAEGLELRFDRARVCNTFDAHRLLHWASQQGPTQQGALKERLLRAYFTEGEALDDLDTLARLAGDVGLSAEAARAALATTEGAREVRADEAMAQSIGVTGVPFFVFDGHIGVSGAQPPEVLLGALRRAWSDASDASEATDATDASEGERCDPDGCDAGRPRA